MILSYSNFGRIRVGHETYRHDVILNNGKVEAQQKKEEQTPSVTIRPHTSWS